ncbi:hypothetical protein COCSUDRAFT_56222 [Coccomyxa subellipsoidea C-169]|uniref:Uncharacterized protein n=1 Tax=Coccomyxa subellipsoidea (strain C-169) TaxID=574566 RepID=I0YTQ6_COCSC|nr:hypothetical protein COCSUDRAFT_56222 [Coccomyxa subellipsoidea C-169]EIE21775.1 hypothetical protein COCSUDRAFT_56222 [Coccomyxa subellipsoidea C-169]|eukprot:XP_005646319.1 hypothetical protein COCSUDRAFT_56222 [Coccomyxa subellipsoidea C-169]
MNFHLDTFDLVVDSPRLPQLAGKQLHLKATLDGVVLDAPNCSCTYTDMSEPPPTLVATPRVAPVSPFRDAPPLPFNTAAPAAGLSRSMSAGQALGLPASKAGSGGGAVATAGPLESPCSLETPPETPEGGLSSSGMDASESAPESPGKGDVQRPMTHAISEGNLVSLDRSAA